uniref:Protein Ycf2 n=1 Tax=Medicago minima TaxID=70957 RepID=A0A4P8F373_9FABA|nr:hypothetical chloroplast RF2 [Medicago minima]QCO73779.1 hypothetical chloroplast RF2 [Medicago minima]
MKEHLFKFWILELREIFRESKNSADFLDSWTEFNSAVSFIHIFFHQESLIKLLDFRIWSIVLSRKGNRYFTIKNVVFFVVAILIYRINNRKMIERKNVYLTGLLPIPMNSIGPSNDTMDDSKDSFNINWYSKLIVPLLYRKKISDRDEDSKYHTRMNNHLFAKEIKEFLGNPTRAGRSFLYDRWLELQLDLNPTERLFKKEEDVSFVLLRQSENKEIANIVKISMYLQNTVSIHPISSDPGCVGVAKDELYSSDSFLNKNRLFGLFHLFHDRNRAGYLLHKRFQEMANLFNLSITKPDLVYHNGFSFSIDFSRLDKKQKFININEVNSWHESKHKSKKKSFPLVLPPLFYEENESFYPNNTYGYIKNLSNLFHRNSEYVIQRYQIGKNILNHRPTRKYTINQHFSNGKKNQKNLVYQTERSMNKDPNAYKYKWSNGSKNFQEHLDHFISEQNSRFQVVFDPFQVVFDRLHMNAYSIDWSEVIDKKKSFYFLSKSLYFLSKSPYFFLSKFLPFLSKFLPFLSNSLPFFFVSFGNIPIHRSEIHMYELKRPNDPLGNPLLESIGLQIVHLKKRKPFLLDDFYTSKKSKLSFNEFNKRQNWISFHTRKKKKKEEEKKKRRKSFSNSYFWKSFSFSNSYFWKSFSFSNSYFWKSFSNSYFSMILHDHYQDQDNWLNLFPVKEFNRSSLISSFYKADLLQFFDHLDNQYFDNQYVERSCNYDFTYFMYGQFLDLYLLNKPSKKKKREPEPMLIEFQYMRLEDLNLGSKMDLIDNPERIHSGGLVKYWKGEYWRKKSEKRKKDRPCLTRYSEKNVPSKKRKKHRPCLPKRFEKGPMYRQRNSVFSTLSKLKQFQPYIIQLLLTRTGHEYLNLIFLDTFFDLLAILRRSPKFQQFVSIFHDIRDGSKRILREKLCLSPRNPISEISSKCLHQFLVSMSVFLENESPLISTHLREFFVLILILLLVTGYLVHTHLVFVSRFSNELQREFEEVKSLMIPSYMIELEKLMDRYPISELNSFGLKDMFVVALEQLGNFLEERRGSASASAGNMPRGGGPAYGVKSIRSKKKDLNLIDLIRIIPNPINRIEFLRNTRHLSQTSKAIYTSIRKRKDVNSDWIDDKIESWILNSDFVADKEREFMVQFSTLTTEKRIDEILLSLTNSYRLSKNNSGYQMIEQPGTIYLRNLIDIHKKYLLNYEFNTSCLAERRIFLAHYQTITYSETACATTSLDFPSHGKPFSLRLAQSPPRGILVIGSIGTGRSYLVKYLATNSYVPFITVSVNKLLDNYPKGFDINDLFDEDDDPLFDDREGTIYSLLPSNEDNCYNLDRYDSDYLDRNYDSHLEFLSMEDPIREDIIPEIDLFLLKLQFELAKAMSPCIIWIPNIHDLDGNESNDLSLGVLVNSLSRDSEKSSTRNILVIASTHIPQKVDPALIAPNKLNTCIKIRRLLIPQQRKHFFSLASTRGFHLEKKMFDTNGCGSITLGSNVRDLVALTNEALSISIIQKKSIIDTNIIRHALHLQTWDFRSQIRSVQDHGILFYQIGRAVSQNLLLSNFSIDPISIYMKKKSCNGGDSDLYKWYLELGTSMKKLTILLYILSCSAGSVAQNLWSLTEENDGLTSYRLLYNDSDLVHGLLEVEGALLGSSQTGSPFDNDGVRFLLRPEPRNPINMIQNGSRSILDHRFLYEKYESGFEEGEGVLDPLEEDLFNHIVWAPRIWRPWEFLFDDCMSNEFGFPYWERSFWDKQIIYDEEGELQENDSEFLEDGTMEYQTQNRSFKEQGVFRISQFIWEPSDPLFLLFQDDPFVSVFSHRELVADEEMPNRLLTCQTKKIYWKYLNKRWFRKNMPEQNFELLIDRQRQFRTNSSLSNGLFRSNTLSESYQYLSNLFLSNGTLLAQITKTLLRKRWLFPEEIVVTICSNNE